MKICLISSSGGHLTQLLRLENLWNKYNSFYVTQKRKISKDLAKKHKMYFIKDPIRNPFSLIQNFFQSFQIFLLENPDLIVTTGGGIAASMCYLGKMFGKKVIFIESLSRVESPSLTGRLVYPIADLFLVQWKRLLKKYGSKAKYWGNVL